ncbi:MAG: 2-oxoacid:ferredoxin oxidoreductase subunit beta [Flavobacteriales bacterium]|nr:2-oxoacid:ferredoxin oxidoreductase subunit beta [Flavobacteriales bacterium]MCB9336180.1 2-oxoacid:ferredoxin oxidoreductase subunit beta [Flavobacteriales bacterium]
MNHLAEEILTAKDFVTDQDVRWCPGCGDYAILKAVQNTLPQIGKNKEDIVFVSGIGCSSRFPYYIETYGFHTIHGRAPAIATGVKLANPNLSVWQVTGDGDALAIGGNHYIHALRRNIDINILLFNNEIYGLTKGQFSPTSQTGIVTKSSPQGTTDRAFNPGKLALGAGATFFARVIDIDPKRMTEVLIEAEKHKGTSLVEILQNCVIFNDKVFDPVTNKDVKLDAQLWLEHGKPMIFGKENNKGLVLKNLELEVVTIGENGITEADILIHDAYSVNDTLHNLLVNMSAPHFPVAFGVIRNVTSSSFDEGVYHQLANEKQKAKYSSVNELINSGVTWEIV